MKNQKQIKNSGDKLNAELRQKSQVFIGWCLGEDNQREDIIEIWLREDSPEAKILVPDSVNGFKVVYKIWNQRID